MTPLVRSIATGGIVLAALCAAAFAAQIQGTIRNENTNGYLEGAEVTLDGGRSVYTDQEGRFVFENVPSGAHQLHAAYVGLDPKDVEVTVANGSNTVVTHVGLTSRIYQMSPFVVLTEREGNAAAIVAQRNAANVQNSISTDAYGDISDGNIGNVLQRLPAIDVTRNNGDIIAIGVRGVPQTLSTISIDGSSLSGANAGSGSIGDRAFPIDNIPSEMISSITVTKAPTPDMPADSLGGNINMKTKSALDVKGRIFTYRLGMNNNTYRGDTEWTPTGALTYIDTLGSARKVGITLTSSYSKTVNTQDRLQNSLAIGPDGATIVNTRLRLLDRNIEHERTGGSAKLDFKPNDRVTLSANVIYAANEFVGEGNDYRISGVNRLVDFSRVSHAAIFSGTQARTDTNRTASLAPGYTSSYEEMYSATNQVYRSDEQRHNNVLNLAFHGEVKLPSGWLRVAANHDLSRSNYLLNNFFDVTSNGIGYSLSTETNRSMPFLQQLYGPSIFAEGADLNRYTGTFQFVPTIVRDVTDELRADWHRDGNLGAFPAYAQIGAAAHFKQFATQANTYNFAYVGPDRVAGTNASTKVNDDNLAQFYAGPSEALFGGYYPAFPTFDVLKAAQYFSVHPEQFSEAAADVTTPKAHFDEDVYSAYGMGQIRVNRLTLLAGVRAERTTIHATGSLRVNTAASFSLVARDADYTNMFPGIHLKYNITPSLIFRANWSTGIGRPAISQQVPTTTVSTNSTTGLGTVTTNPTDLKPMYSNNYDVGLQYYFKDVGVLSVGAFQKSMRDFITTVTAIIPSGPDNGFGGDYADYALVTPMNVSKARIKGLEWDYSQLLPHLPRAFQGSSVFANLTYMTTAGEFSAGGTALPGFRPILANLGFALKFKKFFLRCLYKYQAGGLSSYNANPTLRIYNTEDKTVDCNLKYQFSSKYAVYVDVQNLFNYASDTYIISKQHILTHEIDGSRINIGISGVF